MDDEARRVFGEFVANRTRALMGLAYLLTGDRHSAEDLLQAALAKTSPGGQPPSEPPGSPDPADSSGGSGASDVPQTGPPQTAVPNWPSSSPTVSR